MAPKKQLIGAVITIGVLVAVCVAPRVATEAAERIKPIAAAQEHKDRRRRSRWG